MKIRDFLLAANALTVKNIPILGNYLGDQIQDGLLAGDAELMQRQLTVLTAKVRANETLNEFLLRVLSDRNTVKPEFVEPLTLLKDALDNPDAPPVQARVTLQRLADRFHSVDQLKLWSEAEFTRLNQDLVRTATRVDRVEATLAAATAPRQLTAEHVGALVDRMKRWAGQRVMWLVCNDVDSIALAKTLRDALAKAGFMSEDRWGPSGMNLDGMWMAPSFEGVAIQTAPNAASQLQDAARELVATVAGFGIAAGAGVTRDSWLSVHKETLCVMVGMKPQPK